MKLLLSIRTLRYKFKSLAHEPSLAIVDPEKISPKQLCQSRVNRGNQDILVYPLDPEIRGISH